MLTVYTFGDSVLDCAHYNAHRVTPGGLLIKNRDNLFPEFQGQDLSSKGGGIVAHLAQDGGIVDSLSRQLQGLTAPTSEAIAIISVGGNDLLQSLLGGSARELNAFEQKYTRFLQALPIRPVFLLNVYDPTCGRDENNFTGMSAQAARARHRQVNEIIGGIAARFGNLVDLHRHFLGGDLSWFTSIIEPSLKGASEVRRCLWPHVLHAFVSDEPGATHL